VPSLLDAVRSPFEASGLARPWLAVHGNHDRLLQGTVANSAALTRAATGSMKPIGLPADWTLDAVLKLMIGLAECDPGALAALTMARTRTVTADPGRRIVAEGEFAAAHCHPGARPPGHGFMDDSCLYYRYDHGSVTVLALDTVNPHGGWQGSVDAGQLAWLDAELSAADAEHRYVVLASHHPLETWMNDRSPGEHRVLAAELSATLVRHPSLVLWLNGHTHRTAVTPRGQYWEVTAPSLIDWPQQGRLVELLRGHGQLTIAVTMLDHAGDAPWTGATDTPRALAGLSRQLAGADWQASLDGLDGAGDPNDRDVLLLLPDPFGA
jgi:hypothetical protein